jgi:hypothetical protein
MNTVRNKVYFAKRSYGKFEFRLADDGKSWLVRFPSNINEWVPLEPHDEWIATPFVVSDDIAPDDASGWTVSRQQAPKQIESMIAAWLLCRVATEHPELTEPFFK